MAAFPQYVNATTKKIDIAPPAPDDLGPAEAYPFHQEDRGPLVIRSLLPAPARSSSKLGRYTSGLRFRGRRILREGSDSITSSDSAHPKNECNTEMMFERVAALRSTPRTALLSSTPTP